MILQLFFLRRCEIRIVYNLTIVVNFKMYITFNVSIYYWIQYNIIIYYRKFSAHNKISKTNRVLYFITITAVYSNANLAYDDGT